MFRLDRRIRSASSRIRKLENSAEAALVKAQQTAVRSLSLRSRSSRQQQDSHKRHSNTLLGFLDLSPRKNKTNGEDCSRSTPPRKQNLDEGSIKEMNYVEVQNTDTLEGIAAAHDCTVGFLVKLNKLTSRMVFPGQKLLVPSFDETQAVSSSEKLDNKLIKEKSSGIHRGPGHAVPIPPNEIPLRSALANKFYRHTTTASNFQNIPSKDDNEPEFGRSASELDPEDQDCLQRFMKIKVKQITESDGTIIGTLLVTPNCLMFDPDVDHPLVQEKGSDLYGMVANMENIISVTVYKHISSLTGEKQNKEEDIFDPERVTSTPRMSIAGSRQGSPSSISKNQRISSFDKGENIKDTKTGSNEEERRDDTSFEGDQTIVYGTSAGTLLPGSYTSNASSDGESSNISNSEQLPCIDEERETQLRNEAIEREKRPRNEKQSTSVEESNVLNKQHEKRLSEGSQVVAFLDLDEDSDQSGQRLLNQMDSLDITKSSEQSQRRSPLPFSRYSPGMARKSFGKLGRTLSAKATSFKGSVQSVASGTQKVAHGVVSHTLSAADHIQAGIQNSAKVVASVPGSIMNISTGLIQEGQNGVMEVVESVKDVLSNESNEQQQQQVDKQTMKRERSLATLESLYQRTQQAREQAAIQRALDTGFVLGTEERSVFEKKQKYNDITNNNGQNDRNSIDSPPEPPYYMTVRVDRSRQQRKKTQISRRNSKEIVDSTGASLSASDFFESGCLFGNRRKREFWFAVPRSRVDAIYHFLLQWSPQKYGQVKASSADETNVIDENTSNEMISTGMNAKQDFGAFVVLDRDVDDETLTGEKPSHHFGKLDREWEVCAVREICRRLSLEDSLEPSELPLPDGALQSQVLDEFMIRQIVDVLPPRAEGYPWVNIYSSEKHGFSLATLYRKMSEWKEEMSPVLLIIRDVVGHVFGAVCSTALQPLTPPHYAGTGDSCLLFRFTGEHPHTRELRTFHWTGDNQFFVNATKDFLSIGAGGLSSITNSRSTCPTAAGLWLDADLNNGRSQNCATFNNEPLAGGLEGDFVVQFVEAFGFSMS